MILFWLILSFFILGLAVLIFVINHKNKIRQNRMDHQEKLRLKELQFVKDIVHIQEQERMRIARNIHDQIHPLLFSLRLKLETTFNSNEQNLSSIELLEAIQEDLSHMTQQLAPSVLYKYDLYRALELFISSLFTIKTKFNAPDLEHVDFRKDTSLEVYRIILEIVQNLLKHEQIRELTLSIENELQTLVIRMSHDQRGLSMYDFRRLLKSSEGIGLRSIHLRTKSLKAKLTFKNDTFGMIELKVPMKELVA